MESLVANVEGVKFDIEFALEQQIGAISLPFMQMDKSTSAICVFYIEGTCQKGNLCPFRHIRENRTVVCKHWLRGLCKKGDQCEFLHEFDMTKMPECYFYTRFNACHNKECPFLHIDPEAKLRECPWYMRGFCRHGPNCRHRHVRKVLCLNYLAGFCPDGSSCKFVHAAFELPQLDELAKKKMGIICHNCGEAGHKSFQCPKNPEADATFHYNKEIPISSSSNNNGDEENKEPQPPQPQQQFNPRSRFQDRFGSGVGGEGGYQFHPRPPFYHHHHRGGGRGGQGQQGDRGGGGGDDQQGPGQQGQQPRRALEDVVCYKCGYKGHYANRCSKGHLAFLSHKAGGANPRGEQPRM